MFFLVNAAGKYSYKSFKDGLAPVKSRLATCFFRSLKEFLGNTSRFRHKSSDHHQSHPASKVPSASGSYKAQGSGTGGSVGSFNRLGWSGAFII